MHKPIEEGCLAITVKCAIPENNGKVVRVGKFLGSPPPTIHEKEILIFLHKKRWEIDLPLKAQTLSKQRQPDVYHASEHNLQRIDDHGLELSNAEAEKISRGTHENLITRIFEKSREPKRVSS